MVRRAAAMIGLAGCLLVACSGKSATNGSTSPIPPTPSPPAASSAPPSATAATKASFLAAGNAICQTMNAKQSAVPSPAAGPAAAAQYLDQQIAYIKTAVAQLRALPEPPGETVTLQSLFAKIDALINLAEKESTALKAGNTAQATQIDTQLSAATDDANAAYTAYGLTVCGS